MQVRDDAIVEYFATDWIFSGACASASREYNGGSPPSAIAMATLDWYTRANIKPRHLQLMVALDDFRSIGKVASILNITQPAASKSLAELERALGLKLFERSAQGVHPTMYGECLIRHARTILTDLTQAHEELSVLRSGVSEHVRVGATPTAIHSLLPKALTLLKQRSPRTTVLIRDGGLDPLLLDLWSGKLDLVVGRLTRDRSTLGLEERVLSEDGVTLVSGVNHPLTRRKNLKWSDLKGCPWVLSPVGSLLRGPIEHALERHGIPMPTDRIETDSVLLMCFCLKETNALAFLGKDLANHHHALGLIAVLPLEIPGLMRPMGMIWSQQRPLSASARLMMTCLEEVASTNQDAASAALIER